MFHTDLLRLIVLFTILLFMFMFHPTLAVRCRIIPRLPSIQSEKTAFKTMIVYSIICYGVGYYR